MADAGCDYAIVEATSHALSASWNRLAGCAFDVAVLTNVTQEHLDYHGSMAEYLAAKKRLFAELLPAGAPAVLNADSPEYRELESLLRARGCRVLSYGRSGAELRLERQEAVPAGQELTIPPPAGDSEAQSPSAADDGATGPTSYTVQQGDTLAGIAATFGTTTEALLALNGLDDADLIQPGQELRVR